MGQLIDYLSLVDLRLNEKEPFLLLRPIQEFNIPKPNLIGIDKELNEGYLIKG